MSAADKSEDMSANAVDVLTELLVDVLAGMAEDTLADMLTELLADILAVLGMKIGAATFKEQLSLKLLFLLLILTDKSLDSLLSCSTIPSCLLEPSCWMFSSSCFLASSWGTSTSCT